MGIRLKHKKKFLITVLVLGFFVFLVVYEARQNAQHLQTFVALNPDRDFTLTDQDGKVFHLKDHRGEVVLLFFGYITCPDICPVTLSKLSRVYHLLGGKVNKVLTVFVTIDPERDTMEKIKEYIGYFKLNAVGLTGTKEEIDGVVGAYKAFYEKVETNSAAGYLMDHTDYVYLIGPEGGVNDLIHRDDEPRKIVKLIKDSL